MDMRLACNSVGKLLYFCLVTSYTWTTLQAENCQFLTVTQDVKFLYSHASFPARPYGNGIDRCWVLQLGDGAFRIQLQKSTFKLQYSANCQRDYLEIRDGTEEYHPWRGRYCNTYMPDSLESEGQSLYLRFHTDESINNTGFSIRYSAVRDSFYSDYYVPDYDPLIPDLDLGDNLVAIDIKDCAVTWASDSDPGYIQSHSGYGETNYPKNYKKCWHIRVDPFQYNALQLVNIGYFQLDTKDDCTGDRLVVYSGKTFDSQVIGEACGDGYGFKSFQSNIREDMLVLFVTDDTEESAGFRLEYKVVDSCDHLIARWTPQYFYSHDQYGYTKYTSNLESCWTIDAKSRDDGRQMVIVVQSNSIDMQSSSHCQADKVVIWDGLMGNAEGLGTYCGISPFDNVRTSGPHAFVTFHTDFSIEGYGFNFSYWIELPSSGAKTTEMVTVDVQMAESVSSVHTAAQGGTVIILAGGLAILGVIILAAIIAGVVVLIWRCSRNTRSTEARQRLTAHDVIAARYNGNEATRSRFIGNQVNNPRFMGYDSSETQFTGNEVAGGFRRNGMMSQGFTGNGVTGSGFSVNTVTGPGFSVNPVTGPGLTVNPVTGPGFNGNRVTGPVLTGNRANEVGFTGNGITAPGVSGNGANEIGSTVNVVSQTAVTENGVPETEISKNGANGVGLTGNGITTPGLTGNGADGLGFTGNGVIESGLTENEVGGSKITGNEVTGSRVTENQVTGQPGVTLFGNGDIDNTQETAGEPDHTHEVVNVNCSSNVATGYPQVSDTGEQVVENAV